MKNILLSLLLSILFVPSMGMAVMTKPATYKNCLTVVNRPEKSAYKNGIRHIAAGGVTGIAGAGAIALAVLGSLPSGLAIFLGLIGGLAVAAGSIILLIGIVKCWVAHTKRW